MGPAPQPAEHSPPPGRGLLIVATTSGEAGKRDQAQNEGQFRKIPRRSKVNKKNDMSSAAQNEGRPIWVGLIILMSPS
jgi:hypothetical protein